MREGPPSSRRSTGEHEGLRGRLRGAAFEALWTTKKLVMVGGSKPVLGDRGIYFEPGLTKNLTWVIAEAVSEAAYLQQRGKVRLWDSVRSLSWDRVVASYEELFRGSAHIGAYWRTGGTGVTSPANLGFATSEAAAPSPLPN